MLCLISPTPPPPKYWAIVGLDMTKAVLSVLQSGHCLRKMNFTHIVLIPQKKMKHIICLIINLLVWKMVSRIISKVIANQLKLILPNVIFDAQSAFVPNWLIIDNTTVAFEVLHKMRNKRRGKKGADGSKAWYQQSL